MLTRRSTVATLGCVAALAAAGRVGAVATPTDNAPAVAGPDLDIRAPRFRMPAGACDTHTHIFGPDDKYPYSPTRTYTPPEAPLELFRTVHEKLGIDRCVVVTPSLHGFDNRVTTDAIAESAGRYRGVANVGDAMGDAELRALDRAGIRACRFIFLKRLGGVGDLAAFDRVTRRAAGLGWHIVIYLDSNSVAEYTPLLKSLPAPYVLDHMGTVSAAQGLGGANLQALLALQREDTKCWVKISGPERVSATGAPYLDAVPIAKALIDNAPDRVIWGTDWPHPNLKAMPEDADLVDLVPSFATDAGVREKLLVSNPARLYGFGPG